jgi:hypothetical protein
VQPFLFPLEPNEKRERNEFLKRRRKGQLSLISFPVGSASRVSVTSAFGLLGQWDSSKSTSINNAISYYCPTCCTRSVFPIGQPATWDSHNPIRFLAYSRLVVYPTRNWTRRCRCGGRSLLIKKIVLLHYALISVLSSNIFEYGLPTEKLWGTKQA